MDESFNGELLVVGDGVGDVRSEVEVETPWRFDHQHDVLPLEVTKDSRQGCFRRPERRHTANEERASVAVGRVVKTRPRHDRDRILNTIHRVCYAPRPSFYLNACKTCILLNKSYERLPGQV